MIKKRSIPQELMRDLLFDDWSNDACFSYALIAFRNLQLPEKMIDQLLHEIRYLFADIGVPKSGIIFARVENKVFQFHCIGFYRIELVNRFRV